MPVRAIRATIECDGCALECSVAIEETTIPPAGWCLWDVAKDAVRGGLDYRDASPGDRWLVVPLSSVHDDQMLCAVCTARRDHDEEAPDAPSV